MDMKKFINDPKDTVQEMLEGICLIQKVKLIPEIKTLVRQDIEEYKQNHVVLISGGGSGHEPAHAGYIGHGGISAAVCGEIFSSPTHHAILSAIREFCGPKGCLLIVKNYTGDIFNFHLAMEIAVGEGYLVDMIVIGDDASLLDVKEMHSLRGLAGVVFVHKVMGARAEQGDSLATLKKFGDELCLSIKTMGVSLNACTVPTSGKPMFEFPKDEMALGLGIHGEQGLRSEKMQSCKEIVSILLDVVFNHLNPTNRVAVLLNNLGTTSPIEELIAAREIIRYIESEKPHIQVARLYTSTYLTSLDTHGLSISLMPVDDSLLEWLDAEHEIPAWKSVNFEPSKMKDIFLNLTKQPDTANVFKSKHSIPEEEQTQLRNALKQIADTLLKNESYLTELDSIVGDGDLGHNLSLCASYLLERMDKIDATSPSIFIKRIALYIQEVLGGTTGPLYTMFLLKMAAKLEAATSVDKKSWLDAFLEGISGIQDMGGATEGDRTMLDALFPAFRAFKICVEKDDPKATTISEISKAAREGAERTKDLIAKKGRSSYLQSKVLGTPDPGAIAIALILETLQFIKE